MSHPAPPPDAPTSRPGRRSRKLIVAVAVIAVLVTAAIVVVVLTRDDGSADGQRAERDASAACEVLEELPRDLTTDDLDLDEPEVFELQAIGSLAQAAGKADGAYEDLGKAGQEVFASLARLDHDQLLASLDDLRSQCEDID